ncbi:choline/ethanolaminephosphotransferase 1-like [Silene latifolia]|uniref:choline/ethanolaminephosphotransferase 1-like n=1 Tax=Silene latifolia TaxID=37657 RepID=UPI003D7809C4
MLIYVAHFFTAFVGAHWWAQYFGASFPFLNWVPYFSGIPTYQAMLYLMTIFAVIPTLTFNIQNVHRVVKSRKGSMMLALAMLYPFAMLLLGVLAWDYLSPINLIGTYPHLVVVGTGLAFGFLVVSKWLCGYLISEIICKWLIFLFILNLFNDEGNAFTTFLYYLSIIKLPH